MLQKINLAVLVAILVCLILILVKGFYFQPIFNKSCYKGKDVKNKTEFMFKKLCKGLDLTQEQQDETERIKNEIIDFKQKYKDERKTHKENFKKALVSEIKKEEINKEYLLSLMDKRKPHSSAKHEFMINKLVEFHDILSSEQKQKLADKIEKFHMNKNKKGYKKYGRKHKR